MSHLLISQLRRRSLPNPDVNTFIALVHHTSLRRFSNGMLIFQSMREEGNGWKLSMEFCFKAFLLKALGKLRDEADQIQTYQAAGPESTDSQLEELQQEIGKCKSRIADIQRRLRIFEGEEITTLSQAEFHEQILEETLHQVRLRKQGLQENATSSSSALDWIRKKDPQVHILNFLESNGLLPQRW
ncbi:hypothetical protein PVK06_009039 [Gossypium arboreum]|uniref:K-box domain-containing protein n=1 Tax=Gossypium arboreum TaxID=29729 RepID=A0ABR0QM92_GOSAR|nr:hypothetical protein PVK06_009039 [Gossypium arboreum]